MAQAKCSVCATSIVQQGHARQPRLGWCHPVHGTRNTCGSLLAALDAHPRVAMQIMRQARSQ